MFSWPSLSSSLSMNKTFFCQYWYLKQHTLLDLEKITDVKVANKGLLNKARPIKLVINVLYIHLK